MEVNRVYHPKKPKFMETVLPMSRIRTIMKSSLDTGQVTNDVLFLVTKSTEAFIKYLAMETYSLVTDDKVLRYEHLSEFVQEKNQFEFLLQIIPNKVKVKDFKIMLNHLQESDSSLSGNESPTEN